MTDPKKAKVTLQTVLPPHFDGIIAAYPLTIFNPESVQTRKAPGVFILLDGRRVPCNGTNYDMTRGYAVVVGHFIAFHVENSTEEDQELTLVAHGRALDGGEQAGRGYYRNLFVPSEVES